MSVSPVSRSRAPERVDDGLRLATLPNALSLARPLFLAPILWLLERPEDGSDAWAMLLLVVAGLTDVLDGFLARTRGAISASGKIVDPIADKLLLGGLLIYLMVQRDFPVWLVVLVLLRDAGLMAGAWVFLRRERVVFAADWTGKLTTFFLGLLALAHVVQWRAAYPVLTAIATGMLAASYVSYGHRAWAWTRGGRSRIR